MSFNAVKSYLPSIPSFSSLPSLGLSNVFSTVSRGTPFDGLPNRQVPVGADAPTADVASQQAAGKEADVTSWARRNAVLSETSKPTLRVTIHAIPPGQDTTDVHAAPTQNGTLTPLSEAQRKALQHLAISISWRPEPGADVDGHDGHGGGVIVIDLDEFVHSTYATLNYAQKSVQEGPSSLWKEFKAESSDWHGDPMSAIRDTAVPHSNVDFSLGMAVGGVLVPLALLAVKAGIEEMKESKEHGQVLAEKKHQTEDLIADLKKLLTSATDEEAQNAATLLQGRLLQYMQLAEDLSFASKQNKRAGQVGLGSLLSGGAIAASVVVKAGAQISLAGVAGGVSKIGSLVSGSAAASTAATVAGVASTMVLAPAAGLGAVILGAYFSRKSTEKLKQLRQDLVPTKQFLDEVKGAMNEEGRQKTFDRYHEVFEIKSAQREKFHQQFDWLNKVFLAGSSIYASGALGKAAIAGAAIALGGASIHPAGLITVIALSTAGGLIMGGGSLQFLTGHHKQSRYDRYFLGNHGRLDRDFLSIVDVLHPPPQGEKMGVALRAQLYETLERNETRRQDFLQDIADSVDKYQKRIVYSTDSPQDKAHPRETKHQRSLAQRARATASAAKVFAKEVPHQFGSVKKAAREAQTTDASTEQHTLASWTALHGAVHARAYAGAAKVFGKELIHHHGNVKKAVKEAQYTRAKRTDHLKQHKLAEWTTIKQAAGEAQAVRAERTDGLKLHKLADWVAQPDNFKNQSDFMRDQLQNMIEHLEYKRAVRAAIFPGGPGGSLLPPHQLPKAGSDDAVAPLLDFLKKQDQAMLKDDALHAQALLLADEIRLLHEPTVGEAGGQNPSLEVKMALARARFMCLHAGELCDPKKCEINPKTSCREFAKFLKRDAPGQYKDLRGMLVDTELQATRLRLQAKKLAEEANSASQPVTESDSDVFSPARTSFDSDSDTDGPQARYIPVDTMKPVEPPPPSPPPMAEPQPSKKKEWFPWRKSAKSTASGAVA